MSAARSRPAARSEGEQGRNFTPPSPPWAQWAAGMGWRWSRGSNLVTGPLGSVAGEPDRRQRQLLCLLPVQVAGAWQVRRCVCSAHRPWPQMQVHAPAWGVTPLLTAYNRFSGHVLPNSAFHLSSSNLSWREPQEKGSELHDLCGILVRGIYVANRCPGSPRSRVSAAASPENGSRLRELPA